MVVGMLNHVTKMINDLFGRGIDYDISPEQPDEVTPQTISPEEFTIRTISGRKYITVRRAKSMAQFIIFPGDSPEDKWKCAARAKLIQAVETMYNNGYFDICAVNSAVDSFNLRTPPSVKKALDDLRLIHCVHFDKLSEEVFEAIPRYLTHIFTEGRVPLEPIEREGDLSELNDEVPSPAPQVQELNEILDEAIQALVVAGANLEFVDGLKARQMQALSTIEVA